MATLTETFKAIADGLRSMLGKTSTTKYTPAQMASTLSGITNRGAVTKTLDTSTTSYTIPAGYHNGSGKVSITTQKKTVTSSRSAQTVTPDSGKVLSKVTVNKYPDATGTYTVTNSLDITRDMGATNNYRYVNVANALSAAFTYASPTQMNQHGWNGLSNTGCGIGDEWLIIGVNLYSNNSPTIDVNSSYATLLSTEKLDVNDSAVSTAITVWRIKVTSSAISSISQAASTTNTTSYWIREHRKQ